MSISAPILLDDMVIFVEVVAAGGFTAASERLSLRKSTVSRRLSALEERLGLRLLERTTRQVRLTEAGQDYYTRAVRLVAEARELHERMGERQGIPRGKLRINASQVLAETLLPPIITAYLGQYPKVEVSLSTSRSRMDLLAEGQDLALHLGELEDSSLIARRLGGLRTGYYASAEYLHRQGALRAPEELGSHECVLVAGVGQREVWPFSGPQGPFTLEVSGRLRVDSLRVSHAMVRAGLGVGRLPAFVASEEVRAGLLRPVLEQWSPSCTPLYVLYPSQRHLSPKVKIFIALITEQIGQAPWAFDSSQVEEPPPPSSAAASTER
jgi:DNA-binding transcriptional LysR family regulator